MHYLADFKTKLRFGLPPALIVIVSPCVLLLPTTLMIQNAQTAAGLEVFVTRVRLAEGGS